MEVHHERVDTEDEVLKEKIDKVTSESMSLYYKLLDAKVKNAELMLIRGVTIDVN